MSDGVRVGDAVVLDEASAAPVGIVVALDRTSGTARVRVLVKPAKERGAAACVGGQQHALPVRKPYHGDGEVVLTDLTVAVDTAAHAQRADVERFEQFCARSSYPPHVWYCREHQCEHEPSNTAPLVFADAQQQVSALVLAEQQKKSTPSPRKVLRRLETDCDEEEQEEEETNTVMTLAESTKSCDGGGEDEGSRGHAKLLVVDSTPDLERAASTQLVAEHADKEQGEQGEEKEGRLPSVIIVEDSKGPEQEGEEQKPQPPAEADAKALLFPEDSLGSCAVEHHEKEQQKQEEDATKEAPSTPKQQMIPSPTSASKQPRSMASFLRSSAKKVRRGTLVGWLQESPSKKSTASQKPRLELYSPTKDTQQQQQKSSTQPSAKTRQMPLRRFLSKEDKEVIDRHSLLPCTTLLAEKQAMEQRNRMHAAARVAQFFKHNQQQQQQQQQSLKRAEPQKQHTKHAPPHKKARAEPGTKQGSSKHKDEDSSGDEGFVVSDGHETTDDEPEHEEEEEEDKSTEKEHEGSTAAVGALVRRVPATTAPWSFTLRQSFEVYLQLLVSACIDPDFYASLHADSEGETSQYFLQAALHVERQLLSRRDCLVATSVWEQTFSVCARHNRHNQRAPHEHSLVEQDELISRPHFHSYSERALVEKGVRCEACNRAHNASFVVTLSGTPYDSEALWAGHMTPLELLAQLQDQAGEGEQEQTPPGASSEQEGAVAPVQFQVGSHCHKRAQLFHRLAHFKARLIVLIHVSATHKQRGNSKRTFKAH